MEIVLEQHGEHVVATFAGRPGCGIGPDRETAVRRLQLLADRRPSPFATVRKRLAERTGQGPCHASG